MNKRKCSVKTVSSHTSCSSNTSRSWGEEDRTVITHTDQHCRWRWHSPRIYSITAADQAWHQMHRGYISLRAGSGVTLTFWISGLRISLGPFSNLSMFIALGEGGRKGGVEEIVMKKKGCWGLIKRQIAKGLHRQMNESWYRGFLILLVLALVFFLSGNAAQPEEFIISNLLFHSSHYTLLLVTHDICFTV